MELVVKLLLLFVLAGTVALAVIVILGIVAFFANVIKRKPRNILRITIKLPNAIILVALILICFLMPVFFGEFVENNVVLFCFLIGIPTIIVPRSLTHDLRAHRNNVFAWLYAVLFSFASSSFCFMLLSFLYRFNYLVNHGSIGESEFFTFGSILFASVVVGIISCVINLLEMNAGDYKKISED